MKKQWISVKCGLSRDPKHRQKMGESIWLFLHILDIASWDDGIAHDWKDEAAAEDMGMPVRTLREHRRKLDELGYISCNQKQYTQDIIIHNWTNPREYNGQVYNQKQGGSETSPEEQPQGYTQGYTQGSRKDVTPTLDSKNQKSIGSDEPNTDEMPIDWQLAHGKKINPLDEKTSAMKDMANLIDMQCRGGGALALSFMQARGIVFTESSVKGQRKAARELLLQGVTPEHIREAVTTLTEKGMTVTDLYSVSKTAINIAHPPIEQGYNPQGLSIE